METSIAILVDILPSSDLNITHLHIKTNTRSVTVLFVRVYRSKLITLMQIKRTERLHSSVSLVK